MKKIFLGCLIALATLFWGTQSALAVASYLNGFEVDTSGWNNFGGGTVTRVASPHAGVISADGAYHAVLGLGDLMVGGAYDGKRQGPYTNWGGYESAFPAAGYTTSIDVYLDMAQNPTVGTDTRFDFSSAINNPAGSHRRDFIFSVGTNPATAGQFAISASNNAPGWPANPGRDPLFISSSGWYTLRHTFSDNAGVLSVAMAIVDDDGNVLKTWTLSDPADVIGDTVGGNRYGWFATNGFVNLAIDNAQKVNLVPPAIVPTTADECKKGGWENFSDPNFKNQGACVSYVKSNEHAGKR